MEPLLERLPLEQGVLEGVAQGADGIGEDVVEHVRARVAVACPRAGLLVGPRARRSQGS